MIVINVGLPRTGTTSFCEAFRLSGFQVQHGPVNTVDWLRGNIVCADTPYWMPGTQYQVGAKIVCTIRDYHDWERSMLRHFQGMTRKSKMHAIDSFCYSSVFGDPPFPLTKKKLQKAWQAHTRWVERSGISTIDLCDVNSSHVDKWTAIIQATGLEVEIPTRKFPHRNATRGVEKDLIHHI